MLTSAIIAAQVYGCLDQHAIAMFRNYLSLQLGVTKWIIACDFAVRDPKHPADCMAFSIFPMDADFHDLQADATGALPRDLKASRLITEKGIAWFQSPRRFHFVFSMEKARKVFTNGPGSHQLTIVRDFLRASLDQLNQLVQKEPDQYGGALKRFKKGKHAASANKFNLAVFSDMWIMSSLLATISSLIARESQLEAIGWFPDRDAMTSYCGGIWSDLAFFATRGICEEHSINMLKTRIAIGVPEASGDMWFDHFVRSPDWLAGTIASWKLDANSVPGEKYVQMLENVFADSVNVVTMKLRIGDDGVQISRLAVSKSPINAGRVSPPLEMRDA